MLRAIAAEVARTGFEYIIPGAGFGFLGAEMAFNKLSEPLITVAGERIVGRKTRRYAEDKASMEVTELTPEIFDRHERILKDIRQSESVLDSYDRFAERISTMHILDVSNTNPMEWHFERIGFLREESCLQGSNKLKDIPVIPTRDQAIDNYMLAKLTNRASYHHLRRVTTASLRFRRLILPIQDKTGRVTRLVIAIQEEPIQVQEKFIGRIIPGNPCKPEPRVGEENGHAGDRRHNVVRQRHRIVIPQLVGVGPQRDTVIGFEGDER